MFGAALMSLSCSEPQLAQVHCQTGRGISLARSPQSGHVFDVASRRLLNAARIARPREDRRRPGPVYPLFREIAVSAQVALKLLLAR
jgi:hypothetical protein